MTSQVRTNTQTSSTRRCQPPPNAPSDYCHKLKTGIQRLQSALQLHYEEKFPRGSEQIARAIREAETAAWDTPFPSLFFPALAHLRVRATFPSA